MPSAVSLGGLPEAIRAALAEILNVEEVPPVEILVVEESRHRRPPAPGEMTLEDETDTYYNVMAGGDENSSAYLFTARRRPLTPEEYEEWMAPAPWHPEPYVLVSKARNPPGYALTAAVALAISRASGGLVEDVAAHWADPGPDDTYHRPDEFLEALRLRQRHPDYRAAAEALWAIAEQRAREQLEAERLELGEA